MLTVTARDGNGRVGFFEANGKTIHVPCFMPVGTRGGVKSLSGSDLSSLGFEVMLANTYHLMLRPGAQIVKDLGGVGRFARWPRAVLTDSGGYQVFSLKSSYSAHGVHFKSVYDGSRHELTPERACEIQLTLGSDIQMALDVCCELPSDPGTLRGAAELSVAWGDRALRFFHATSRDQGESNPLLYGIVQGGDDSDLRAWATRQTRARAFDGLAIGGLSVGEPKQVMTNMIEAVVGQLDFDPRPRYLMGVGDPVGILEAVSRGIDMFDCVLPTRLARHGTVLTDLGKVHLKARDNGGRDDPMEEGCTCEGCANCSRGYIRHLFNVGDPTALRLASIHNLAWMYRLMTRARYAIEAGSLTGLISQVKGAFEGEGRLDC